MFGLRLFTPFYAAAFALFCRFTRAFFTSRRCFDIRFIFTERYANASFVIMPFILRCLPQRFILMILHAAVDDKHLLMLFMSSSLTSLSSRRLPVLLSFATSPLLLSCPAPPRRPSRTTPFQAHHHQIRLSDAHYRYFDPFTAHHCFIVCFAPISQLLPPFHRHIAHYRYHYLLSYTVEPPFLLVFISLSCCRPPLFPLFTVCVSAACWLLTC